MFKNWISTITNDQLEYKFLEEIWRTDPYTKIVEQANPDVIDINYGCPVKKVVSKSGSRSSRHSQMVKLTEAVVKLPTNLLPELLRLG